MGQSSSNREAVGRLFGRFTGELVRFLVRRVRNRADARDLAQETTSACCESMSSISSAIRNRIYLELRPTLPTSIYLSKTVSANTSMNRPFWRTWPCFQT